MSNTKKKIYKTNIDSTIKMYGGAKSDNPHICIIDSDGDYDSLANCTRDTTNKKIDDAKERYYETNIINPIIKVIALSDIHGDIQSFIISLRDCAKVIRKKTPTVEKDEPDLMKYEEFSSDKYDKNMEQILLFNLNTDEDKYIEDLNYEWCGENTHVVICGDIIDPYRIKLARNCMKTGEHQCAYYPQIELKILMFINALNKHAALRNGKIIKLLGNHELLNIGKIANLHPEYPSEYSYPQDQAEGTSYYKGVSRINIFEVGNFGFKLLFEDGCGVLIKINGTIFVHGDLVDTYENYDLLNQLINNPTYHISKNQQIWENGFFNKIDIQDSLFNTDRGENGNISKRIELGNTGDNSASDKFCESLLESFKKFKGDGKVITDDVKMLKLVIGHCPQYYSSITFTHNTTYTKKIRSDNVMEVFGDEIYSGLPVFDKGDNRTKIFGITLECLIPNTQLNRVYRVDIGSSRGFDNYDDYPTTLEKENQIFYSKTPQILEINADGKIYIIKSKMRNTRIHLPRPEYEATIKDTELDINTTAHGYYKYKYLKYKNKYLQLKQILL
jgi:hypothetical protein